MKRVRKFDGIPYAYVGTYWDPEIIRLCLNSGRAAGYLMRRVKAPNAHILFNGTPYEIFAHKTPQATGPLMIPAVVRGPSHQGDKVDFVPGSGQVIVWTKAGI